MAKRVLLINDLGYGGAEKVLTTLWNFCLHEDVWLVTLKSSRDFDTRQPEKIKNLLDKMTIQHGLTFVRGLRRGDIGVIQSHLFKSNFLNCLLKIFFRNYECQLVHCSVLSSKFEGNPLKQMTHNWLVRNLYPFADLHVFKSEGMRVDYERYIDCAGKAVVINNPCDFKDIQQKLDGDLPASFDKTRFNIVSLGRLHSQKRVDDLVRVIATLPEKVHLHILGDGAEAATLKALVAQLGLRERVWFYGSQENPYKFLAKANAYVSCSSVEGFPNALVEALACTCPVIHSDCLSGPREVLAPSSELSKTLQVGQDIEEAEYGILFPTGDVKALNVAICRLMNDESLTKIYKERSFARVSEFMIESVAARYQQLLRVDCRIVRTDPKTVQKLGAETLNLN